MKRNLTVSTSPNDNERLSAASKLINKIRSKNIQEVLKI